jgi:phage gp29-like protein
MKYLTDELINSSNNLSFFNHLGILPNPDKILRKNGNTFNKIRELLNDSHVWSCIQSRKSGTINLESFIDSNNCDNNIVEFVKDFLNQLDINSFINEILDSVLFGFQVHEILWKNEADGKIVPQRLIAGLQELFAFDKSGDLKLFKNDKNATIRVPENKFIVSKYQSSPTNPYGSGLLSKCYWNVTFKNSAVRFWVNYMEKYGMPLLLGQYTRGATQTESDKLAEALLDMTDSTVIVTPMDINIDIKEAARNSSVDLYRQMINHCNSEISKTLLSETLTTEIDSGSFAAAQTHFRVRKEVVISDSKIVENSINKLISYAVKINFNINKFPKFQFVINDSDNLTKIERDIKLVQSGVKFTKDYWMKTYGLSDSDFII